jgi:regulator of cell morphogenesis and NO signaling
MNRNMTPASGQDAPLPRVDPQSTVEEIARRFPAALPVFDKYKIDLCCGGRHALAFVATKHQIPLESILKELDAALEQRS